METVQDVFEHCRWLIDKGRGAEPGKLFMPKVEAQRRKENKEGYRRIVFQVDEQFYRDWHEQKDRYVEASGGNPMIAYAIMLRLLAQLPTGSIEKLAGDEQIQPQTLGDAD